MNWLSFPRISIPASEREFFDVEILKVVAEALFEAGIDPVFLPASAKYEFLAAMVAANSHFDASRVHRFLPGGCQAMRALVAIARVALRLARRC